MPKKVACYPTIERRRERMGMTKKALAEYLELSRGPLYEKLSGHREFSLTEARYLADLWGISLDELVGRKVPSCPIYIPNGQPHMKEERL